MQKVDAVEKSGAADDAAWGLRDEPHDRVTRHRFTRAGFADYTESLSAFDTETHAIDGAVNTVARMKMSSEVVDVKEGHGSCLIGEWVDALVKPLAGSQIDPV